MFFVVRYCLGCCCWFSARQIRTDNRNLHQICLDEVRDSESAKSDQTSVQNLLIHFFPLRELVKFFKTTSLSNFFSLPDTPCIRICICYCYRDLLTPRRTDKSGFLWKKLKFGKSRNCFCGFIATARVFPVP